MLNFNEISTAQFSDLIKDVFCSTDNVRQFGQSIPNPNNAEQDPTTINTFNMLVEMSENMETFDLNSFGMYEDTLIDTLELVYTEVNHINTYNWSSPISNHLDFKVFQSDVDEDQYFIVMNVQNGYSDVRTGYNLQIGFSIDCRHFDWCHIFTELNNYMESFEIKGFYFDFDMFMESGCFRVYNEDLEIDLCDVYIGNFEDCKQWIEDKEYLNA